MCAHLASLGGAALSLKEPIGLVFAQQRLRAAVKVSSHHRREIVYEQGIVEVFLKKKYVTMAEL